MREIVVKQILEGLCLNAFVEGSTCNCGAIHSHDGHVVEVESPGDKFGVYQIAMWYLWSLKIMSECGQTWHCGLSMIVPPEKLEKIFDSYFGDLGLFEEGE